MISRERDQQKSVELLNLARGLLELRRAPFLSEVVKQFPDAFHRDRWGKPSPTSVPGPFRMGTAHELFGSHHTRLRSRVWSDDRKIPQRNTDERSCPVARISLSRCNL